MDDSFTHPMMTWMFTATEDEIFQFSQKDTPRCNVCGRVVASPDCEPDVKMCWIAVSGTDPRCDLLRAHYQIVQTLP